MQQGEPSSAYQQREQGSQTQQRRDPAAGDPSSSRPQAAAPAPASEHGCRYRKPQTPGQLQVQCRRCQTMRTVESEDLDVNCVQCKDAARYLELPACDTAEERTVSDIASRVAVDAPCIDFKNIVSQLQGMPFLNSTIYTLAGASTTAVRPALHVSCQAIALCLELAVLKPACHIVCLLMLGCLLDSWVKGILEHGLHQLLQSSLSEQ